MKKAFFALAILFLASCVREYLFEKPQEEPKQSLPLRTNGTATRWSSSTLNRARISTGIFYTASPIASAEYRVTDKESHEVVRRETLNQIPCGPCHKR